MVSICVSSVFVKCFSSDTGRHNLGLSQDLLPPWKYLVDSVHRSTRPCRVATLCCVTVYWQIFKCDIWPQLMSLVGWQRGYGWDPSSKGLHIYFVVCGDGRMSGCYHSPVPQSNVNIKRLWKSQWRVDFAWQVTPWFMCTRQNSAHVRSVHFPLCVGFFMYPVIFVFPMTPAAGWETTRFIKEFGEDSLFQVA